MRTAERYQVPRSILLGRGWPRPGEPLFLPDDTEAALEWESFSGSICRTCGTRHEEWLDNPDAYVAVATRCPGQEAIAVAEKSIPEEERVRGAHAVLVPFGEWEYREEIRDAAARLGLTRPKFRSF